jgi:imidazolonepropionase
VTESLPISRSGWAFRARGRVIRRIDLAPLLGVCGPDSPRFEAVKHQNDRILFEFEDRGRESVPEVLLEKASERARRERKADFIIENAGVLMTAESTPDNPLGIIRNGSVVSGGGRILWAGPQAELKDADVDVKHAVRLNASGRLVTPGLIDCHAHPVFAGNRAREFAMRAAGKTYQDIAAAGGGIVATATATRNASTDELIRLTFDRMTRAYHCGTTTIEAKSGYALTADGELRLLEVAQAVDALHRMDLDPTLLGAHAVPDDRKNDRKGYIKDVIENMIPEAKRQGLCNAVDVYCDQGAFSREETLAILRAAKAQDLEVRAHVGQFSDLGGPELLAELGALSADHLEHISEAGARALAAHGVVAVLLPGACTQLKQEAPPVARLRQAGVAMAVATDMNPGTSFGISLPVQMWLACTRFGMTVEEAWLGVTKHAARAMGRHDVGALTVGAITDLLLWDAETPEEIPYRYDDRLVATVIKSGRPQ